MKQSRVAMIVNIEPHLFKVIDIPRCLFMVQALESPDLQVLWAVVVHFLLRAKDTTRCILHTVD